MRQYVRAIRKTALLCSVIATSVPALAADVTPERLINADKEPQNWLMNHRTYDGQRFSPLDRINKTNVKGLKLAYAVPLGGGAGNEFTVATPLVEDGFLYTTDSWGVLYKIDVTSGQFGRIVAHGSQAGAPAAEPRRGLVGQSRHQRRRHLAGTHHRHRQG
jgi:alcohol dehydrogenase (cytochrome c)